MTPRILFLSHTAALGGAELYLRDVAAHLRSHCAVALLDSGPLVEQLTDRGVPTHVLRAATGLHAVRKTSGVGAGLRALPGLLQTVRRLSRAAAEYDLIYANSQKALVVGTLAAKLAGRPMVWNLHDLLTADHFSPFTRRVATTTANLGAALVVCNSTATERAFRESGGRVPTTIIYNGFDPGVFRSVVPEAIHELRRSLGLGQAPTVGVFSRLAAWKGQHVLLEALPSLPGVHALFVGEALFGSDEAYAARLHRQADALGVSDRVHFLGFRDDVPDLMAAVDVVAHTSVTAEPFGRVIVEGMLSERPVVATRAGGALEIITDGVDGLLTPPGDASALGNALRDLFAHPDWAVSLARAGAETAGERFSITTSAQDVVAASMRGMSN